MGVEVPRYHLNFVRTSWLTTFSAGHSPRLSDTIAWAADRAMSLSDFSSVPAAWGAASSAPHQLSSSL